MPRCTNLLQSVVKNEPDVVVIYDETPKGDLFHSTLAVARTAPCPVVVFTDDPDAEKIETATRSGIQAYVVNGYSPNRLRSVIHLALARFRHEQSIRAELAEINQRFDERKLVDRARGILMGARQLREEEAYRALRRAAMDGKERIGQVAQRVIDSARYAEAINRAGQLRMLSQRLAKLFALVCTSVRPVETAGLLADSIAHVESNLASLSRNLSRPTFGDLIEAVEIPWRSLQAVLASPPRADRLGEVDRHAEAMLLRADQLAANLEISGFAAALRVINVSGRQRMLSQRLAKEALMASLLGPSATAAAQDAMSGTREQLVDGLDYLQHLPLSNPDIGRELQATLQTWARFELALQAIETESGRDSVADLSEALLGHFELLTDQLERGMQSLVF